MRAYAEALDAAPVRADAGPGPRLEAMPGHEQSEALVKAFK